MAEVDSLYVNCEDLRFPRLTKRSSTKYTRNKHIVKNQQTCTIRNMSQKEKQNCDKLSKNYRELERNQKLDGTPSRIYHCATCNSVSDEPCLCNYVQWCGKDCKWEDCNESNRLGIRDELAVSYDVLCEYHARKYEEYMDEE